MNFQYMPELHWKNSYYVLWIAMSVIGIGLITYFRRRRWI
jgi:magnesium transporter